MSECVCPAVEAIRFWCERNQLHMVGRLHHLCQTSQAHRDQFASGTSPHHVKEARLQGKPPPPPPPPNDYPTLEIVGECAWRGKSLGTLPCDRCGEDRGKPFEAFECAVHGRCTYGRRIRVVHACLGCLQRKLPDA
jgi:hypothetical protein